MRKVVKLPGQKRLKVTLAPGKANVFAAAKTNTRLSSSFIYGIPMQAIHTQKSKSAPACNLGSYLRASLVGEAGIGD